MKYLLKKVKSKKYEVSGVESKVKSKKYEVLLQARLAKAPLNVECGKGRNKPEPLFVKIIQATKPKFMKLKKDQT